MRGVGCKGFYRSKYVTLFKRFEDMQTLRHTKTLGIIQVDEAVWKRLTKEEKREIEEACDEKLGEYYGRRQ